MKPCACLLLMLLLAGCGKSETFPAGRLRLPAGKFSYVTPEGWHRTKLAGVPFTVSWADADLGAKPNIYVDAVEPLADLAPVSVGVIKKNQGNFVSYVVTRQVAFATSSTLPGLKIAAHRNNKDGLPLALFHYLIADRDRVIIITCTCAEPAAATYEPVFDAAMKSLQPEGR